MTEKYLIVGLMVAVAVLIIVVISLVAALQQSRAKTKAIPNARNAHNGQ